MISIPESRGIAGERGDHVPDADEGVLREPVPRSGTGEHETTTVEGQMKFGDVICLLQRLV